MKKQLKIWKQMIPVCICICMLLTVCSGCTNQTGKSVSSTADCVIGGVENMVGSHSFVCANKRNTYVYQSGAICRLNQSGTQKLVSVHGTLKQMECTDKNLYYYTDKFVLYKVSLTNGKVSKLADHVKVLGIYSFSDHVYVSQVYNEENSFFDSDCQVYDYSDETPVCLEDWVKNQQITYDADGYAYIDYKEEQLSVMRWGEDSGNRVVSISKGEQQYSTNKGVVYVKGAKGTVEINADFFEYAGEIHENDIIKSVNKEQGETDKELISVDNHTIYAIYQYGTKRYREHLNPPSEYKNADALIAYDMQTKETHVIYQTTSKQAQIAGFDIKTDVLYLQKTDGLYRGALDGTQLKKIWDNKEHYQKLKYESVNGKLYVFNIMPKQPVFIDVVEP